MITLSNGGDNVCRTAGPPDAIAVGTVDGVAMLTSTGDGWTTQPRTLSGVSVGAVTATVDAALFAATHGAGVARSTDGGATWT